MVVKRVFDLFASAFGLLLAAPLFVVLMLWIKLDSAGPVFFRQERVGLRRRSFMIHKFRTMVVNAEALGPQVTVGQDARITRSGRFLRKFKLDELPQLWSIIKGDTSFVGPRPALFNQYDLIQLRTSAGVHKLLPGLTGWAQINGRDELSIAQKVALDIEYLKKKSFGFDVKIIILTAFAVLRRDNVAH